MDRRSRSREGGRFGSSKHVLPETHDSIEVRRIEIREPKIATRWRSSIRSNARQFQPQRFINELVQRIYSLSSSILGQFCKYQRVRIVLFSSLYYSFTSFLSCLFVRPSTPLRFLSEARLANFARINRPATISSSFVLGDRYEGTEKRR